MKSKYKKNLKNVKSQVYQEYIGTGDGNFKKKAKKMKIEEF